MERASRVMYSIANIFTWVLVALSITMIVLSALSMAHIIDGFDNAAGLLVYYIIVLVVALVTISLVRIAKDRRSSKGWDVLFLVLGIVGWNIFYFLGGLFGIIARR